MTSEIEKSHAPHCWSAVVMQQNNCIVTLPQLDCIQCNYIFALPLPTSKPPTMVGVTFSIIEVVYSSLVNESVSIGTRHFGMYLPFYDLYIHFYKKK
jgi:hypothetical protein